MYVVLLRVNCYLLNVWDRPFYVATKLGVEPTLSSADDLDAYAILFCKRQYFSNVCLALIVSCPSDARLHHPLYLVLLLIARL